jgi:hypothetical protein
MDENSLLVTIGARAFAKLIARRVERIGRGCFTGCMYLYRLRFGSSESLKRAIGDRSLDDALDELGVMGSSTLIRIDVDDRGVGNVSA